MAVDNKCAVCVYLWFNDALNITVFALYSVELQGDNIHVKIPSGVAPWKQVWNVTHKPSFIATTGSRQPRQPRCDSVTHSIIPSALCKVEEQEKKKLDDSDGTLLPRHLPGQNER